MRINPFAWPALSGMREMAVSAEQLRGLRPAPLALTEPWWAAGAMQSCKPFAFSIDWGLAILPPKWGGWHWPPTTGL